MSHTIDAIPTVKEELERKTVELLESLVHRSETDRLNKSDLSLVGRAVWSITSGLVSTDVSELCAAVSRANAPRKLTRHFTGKGSVLSVIWNADSHGYLLVTRDATTQERKVRAINTEIGQREDELKNLFGALARSGYTELPT